MYNDMRIYMCGSLKNFFMLKINFLLTEQAAYGVFSTYMTFILA